MNKYSVAEKVNSEVNNNTKYVSDQDNYGTEEYWRVAVESGDCEDFALKKRMLLLESGYSLDDLSLCTCITESGGGHCVLFVNTDKGGFILDNRCDWPMVPRTLPYKWVSIHRGGKWYELSGWQ